MPIALITGPANAGKAQLVLEAVRAHVARGEHPLLVVPTEADQARYRRELAAGGAALGARVERFEGLLAAVLECVGKAHPPTRATLGPLAREHVLARLADARPGMASELARFIAELETQRVTPARLRGALRIWRSAGGEGSDEQPRADETSRSHGQGKALARRDGEQLALERVCGVFERYHEALAKIGRADRELRVTSALDTLRREPALWRSMPVLLYGFDDFTDLQLDAIQTLGGVVGARVTVSLAYEPGRVVFAGRAATFQRLVPLADAHTELAPRAEYYAPRSRRALHHLERSLLSDEVTRVEPQEAVRLLEGGSPRAELELVAGEVRALLDMGVQAGEIAIVHRSPEQIAGLIGELLEDFDIPFALHRRVRFAHTAIGRALLGLLRCAVGESELADLLAWLAAPGMLATPDGRGAGAKLVDRLEANARRRGALDGARARALWEAEHWPLERIDRVRSAAERGALALSEALAAELQRLFCAPRRRIAAVLGEHELDEARALTAGCRALEELGELARAAAELAPTPSELIDVLERLELSAGERSDASRVTVVDPLSLRARRARMVFACGLQEGVFPAPRTPHPLLAEEHRRDLASASGLVLRAEPDALAGERYLLYALVSRPQERLTLSWHTADEDGAPLAPSLFVDDVCDLFADSLRQQIVRRFAGAAGWPGPGRPAGAMLARDAALAGARSDDGADDRAGAGLGAGVSAGTGAGLGVAVGAGAGASAGTGLAVAIRPHPIRPLRDERVLSELRERELWSASSLESWTGCPVKWFVERLLRCGEIDPRPEPIARGGLAHAALRSTLERLRERTGSARLTDESLGLAKRLLRDVLVELQSQYPLSVAPERLPGARRRLQADLERYLECGAEQESALEPTHLELEFGFDRDGLPALDLGEGLVLRGRIDRVDVGPAGEAVVYDYKGRSAPPGAKWACDGSFQVALYMRAVERLLGHTAVGGFYQPLAGRDLRARGVLDGDSDVELECVRTDRLDRGELRELIDRCISVARKAVTEAKAGALEPRPDTCAYSGGCAYPTICRCEL